jgi:hypothetical protein
MSRASARSADLPRDVAFAATTSGLFVPGPQSRVNIDDPENTPHHILDRNIANGGLRYGAMKVRLYSASGRKLPMPFDEFSHGDICGPFGIAADDPDLLSRYYEFGLQPSSCDHVYDRWRRVVHSSDRGGMTLRSVISDWELSQKLVRDDSMPPDRAFTNAFRRFRSVLSADQSLMTPYITDWNCSLFHMHHVDQKSSPEWRKEHYFGVGGSISVVVFSHP